MVSRPLRHPLTLVFAERMIFFEAFGFVNVVQRLVLAAAENLSIIGALSKM